MRQYLILFLLVFLFIRCSAEGEKLPLFLLHDSELEPVFGFWFTDYVLKRGLTDKKDPIEDSSGIQPEFPAFYSKKAWPFFENSYGKTCFRPQGPVSFYYERGFTLEYCFQGIIPADVQEFLNQSATETEPRSAWPEYRFHPFRIRVGTAAQLRDSFTEIQFIYNGAYTVNSRLKLISEAWPDAARIDSAENPVYGGKGLPSRFPELWLFAAAGSGLIHFLYPLPSDNNRFLAVTVEDPDFTAESVNSFNEALRLTQRLISELKTKNTDLPEISETAFPSQKSITSFIKIISGEDTVTRVTVTGDSGNLLDEEVLILKGGVYQKEGQPDSFSVTLGTASGGLSRSVLFSYENYTANSGMLPPDFRSLSADTEGQLSPYDECTSDGSADECSGKGYHPAFRSIFVRKNHTEDSLCRHGDLRLTEWNPFGVYKSEDASIQPGGKFAEFQVLRDCDPSSLLLYADQWPLELPFRMLRKNEIILFTASQTLFKGDFIYSSYLRSLNINSSVCSVSLKENLKICYRVPPQNPSLFYIHGHRNKSHTADSLHLKAAHSLIFINGSEVFHPVMEPGFSGSDLITVYRNHHAMSPGYLPQYQNPDTGMCRLRLQEIMPQGARSDDGKSAPGDEFAEFGNAPDSSPLLQERMPGLCIFTVHRISNGAEKHYAVPPSGNPEGIITIIQDEPVCSQPLNGTVIFSDLSLPNAEAVYTLKDISGNTVQELIIDQDLYSLMDQTMRRSIRINGDQWELSDGGGMIPYQCSIYTRASPGYNP